MPALTRSGLTYYYPDASIPALVRFLSNRSVAPVPVEDGFKATLGYGRGAVEWVNSEIDAGRRLVVPADILEGGEQVLHTVSVAPGANPEWIVRASMEPSHGIVMETGFERAPDNPRSTTANNPNILERPSWSTLPSWGKIAVVGAGGFVLWKIAKAIWK